MPPAADDSMVVHVAGHEMRLRVDPEERAHVEAAAKEATARIRELAERSVAASPAKVAAMAAFQFACDLSVANELLDEAESLHEELKRHKEAVARLESLLHKVDGALTA